MDPEAGFAAPLLPRRDGHRLRNSEVITVRDNQVIEVEVYFGWTLPHLAPPGGYLEGEDI